MAKWNAEAANIAAQRDAAEKRAQVAEEARRAAEADFQALQHEAATSDDGLWRFWTAKALALAKSNDDLRAELARIRAADRQSITVRTTEAAKMRKGQAI